MNFSNPVGLLLLVVVIPVTMSVGWPRLSYRRRRDITSLLLRLLLILLIILALSGLQVTKASNNLAVVFLVDVSDSIDHTALDRAENYVRDAMTHMNPEDKAGIVMFGKNALIDRPLSNVKDPGGFSSTSVRLETNIEGAIRLALAMFPSDAAKRIVLLSDGQETTGDALEAARLAAATSVQIDVVPLPGPSGPEMAVTDLQLPAHVATGEIFDVTVTVQSTVDATADLTLLSAGSVVKMQRITVKPGLNTFVYSLQANQAKFTDFQARLDPTSGTDTYYQNNELGGFTEVTGPPRVLIVSSAPEEVAPLLPAIQQTGIQTDIAAPGDLPIGLTPLAAYKAVVLANVSATVLTDQQMKVLQSYVRDLGGGLVVIGGPTTYGPGGYFQTPLEETLPVESRIKDQKRIPKLLIVYVIDRSGSMEVVEPGSTATRLDLGKEAIRRSIQFLLPQDRLGVVSYDTNPSWMVPIQDVTADPSAILNTVGTLGAGGGDGTLVSMEEAMRKMSAEPASLKHVIILTDGDDAAGDPVKFAAQMYNQYGITVSAIDIEDSVQPAMRDLAAAGHGVYYHLDVVQNLPQIFVADTVFANRAYIQEKEFTPQRSGNSQILNGITAIPNLLGYVITTPKDTATIDLTVPGFDDPLLAEWQYGLGRAVAWTSDATTRWAKQWATWEDYGRFWSQVIRSTIVEGTTNKLDIHVEQRADQPVLVASAHDASGGLLNGLQLKASVVDPNLGAQPITLQQVAPGQYESAFNPTVEGAYLIGIAGQDSGTPPVQVAQTAGWVLSYSSEYRIRATNTTLLANLATLTQGREIADQPEVVFNHDLQTEYAAVPPLAAFTAPRLALAALRYCRSAADRDPK